MNFYVTITGVKHYFGKDIFHIGQRLFLFKEPNNQFDDEAIKVCVRAIAVFQNKNSDGDTTTIKIPHFEKIGYVANSTKTVYKGTMSSGRIYDKVPDSFTAKVMFITNTSVIAKVIVNVKDILNDMMLDFKDTPLNLEDKSLSDLLKMNDELDKINQHLDDILGDNSNDMLQLFDIEDNSDNNIDNDFNFNLDDFDEDGIQVINEYTIELDLDDDVDDDNYNNDLEK